MDTFAMAFPTPEGNTLKFITREGVTRGYDSNGALQVESALHSGGVEDIVAVMAQYVAVDPRAVIDAIPEYGLSVVVGQSGEDIQGNENDAYALADDYGVIVTPFAGSVYEGL